MAQRQALRWLSTALLVLVALILLTPVQVGGATSYVVVDGESMEPTFEDGDLVLARARSQYEVGDVVTYIAPDGAEGDYRVIHRIVEKTPDGFVTRGDNRDEVDDWIITDDDILGASALRIPRAGELAATPLRRAALLGLAAGLLAAGAGGVRMRRRRTLRPGTRIRRRKVMANPNQRHRGGLLAGPPWMPLALVVSAVAAMGFGWLAWTSLRAPETVTAVAADSTYVHLVEHRYTAFAEPGVVYPSGRVGPVTPDDEAQPETEADPTVDGEEETRIVPPQALYSDLIDEIVVDVDYALRSDGEVAVTGWHQTYLTIETAEGWSSRERLGDAVAIDGASSSVERTLRLDEARDLIGEVAAAAGTTADGGVVGLESEVRVAGTVDGVEIDDVVSETFEVTLGSPLLEPSGELAFERSAGEAQETARPNAVAGMTVPAARALGAGGLLAALIAVGWFGSVAFLGVGRPEHEVIAARYGGYLVTVHDNPVRGAQPMAVASMPALVRLAKREHTAILHEPRPDGRHRYVVPDGLVAFFYETEPAQPPRGDAPPAEQIVLDLQQDAVEQAASGSRED